MMGAFLFLGALWGGCAAHPALPASGKYEITAVLSADAALREDGAAAAYLERVLLADEAGETRLSRAYWTYVPEGEDPFLPREGDRVAFTGRAYVPAGQENPYGFDFRLFLLEKGVTMGITGAVDGTVLDHPGRGAWSLTYHARQWLEGRLEAVFGPDSALPAALLIGQREKLPEETRQRFSDAGVAHLLAVSGLHVGLLAWALTAILRRWLPPGALLMALGAFLLGYCALLDFSAPVARASLLLALGQLRRIARRAPDGLTTLSAAFLLILAVQPMSLFSVSFQLSFLAVLGIVTLGPVLQRWTARLRPAWLWSAVCVTLAATLGAFVPTVQTYHRFSLVGLLINPALCALFSMLLPVYAAVLMIGCLFLPAGTFLAAAVNPVTRLVVGAVEWIGGLPFATVRVPYLPWYCVLALFAAGALATRYVLLPAKRRAALGAALTAAAFSVWGLTLCRDVQYVQFAAGQADCAVILDGADTVVVDAGEYGGDLASYLLSTGRNADHLILTHLHRDHCMGVQELLDARISVGCVYLPEGAEDQQIDPECLDLVRALAESGVPVVRLAAGDRLETNRVRLEAAWPQPGRTRPGQDANRYALVLLADLDGFRLLTASDIVGGYEIYAAREADALKVPHHGSKNSTGTEFLSIVSPEVAIITGSRSSSSLPHPDTLARLSAAGVSVYNTGVCGAVTLTVRSGAAEIVPFLR